MICEHYTILPSEKLNEIISHFRAQKYIYIK